MEAANDSSRRRTDRALLLLAVILGAALRIIPAWDEVFARGGVNLVDNDSFYHLRRIVFTVRHFPAVLSFDPFVNFPEGARIYWPPGFDGMLATAALLLPGIPSQTSIERLCSLIIPLLAIAAILAVYGLARASFAIPGEPDAGRPAAGAASLVFALQHDVVHYSVLGYVDHHVLEPFFLALALGLLLAAFSRAGYRAAFLGGGAGLVAALSCLFITEGILVVGLVGAAGAWEAFWARMPGSRPGGLSAIGVAALSIIPLSMTTYWGQKGEMTYLALSPWQAHLALAGAGLAVALACVRWRSMPPRARMLVAGLGMTVAAAAFVHGGSRLLGPLQEATGFMSRAERVTSTVVEARPLWAQPMRSVLCSLTPLGLVAPFVLLWTAFRRAGTPGGAAALIGLVVFGMGLAQVRFMLLAAIAIALSTGALVAWVWRRTPRASWRRGAVLAFVALCVGAPHLVILERGVRAAGDPDRIALARRFSALAEPAARIEDPNARPSWGVIAPWPLGHQLVYRGGVPVVASPFGLAPWHIEGILRAARFRLSVGDEASAAICRALRVRYVVTGDPFRIIESDAQSIGLPIDRFVRTARPGDLHQGYAPTDRLRDTANYRLHLFDGGGATLQSRAISALPSFRLVWESRERMSRAMRMPGTSSLQWVASLKIFEVVRPARIEGRCMPNVEVRLEVPVRSNLGRRFTWADRVLCDGSGHYAIRTPYPSPVVRMSQGDRDRTLSVSDDQSRKGARIAVDFVSP